ncbi:MAG: hypothetical protein AAGU14_02635 [Eubacteriaceae bacterium]
MADNKRNMPSVKSFEDFFKKYKIDGYITADDLPDLSPYATSGDLDSYVKTADIVDDITTGGEGKPLSAEQGKILAGLSLYADDPYGSNSNGYYLKFANGVMECWISMSVTNQAINTAYGSLYQGTRTWTFPAEFYEKPTIFCSEFKWGTGASWGTANAPNTGQTVACILRCYDISSRAAGTNTSISAFAKGRWKA